VDVVIPRVHSYTKKKNTESSAHINTYIDGEGRAKSRAYFMQDFSAKEDVAAVADNPEGDTPSRKYMNYPVRVNALKSFGKIR